MRTWALFVFLAVWIAVTPATARAQVAPAQDSATSDATAPQWDPLKANKDIEVGTFYFKHGNYDAAIDRFEEAARLHPGLALPYQKLGETYEKKKDWEMAADSYRKYLELYRTSPDKKKIQKRIANLEKRIAKEAEQDSSLRSE